MANPIVHWELMVNDVERAKGFYGRVFEWTFEPMGPEYTLIQTGEVPAGGLMQKPPSAPFACLNSYFRVADVNKTLGKALEAGGKVIVPRTEIAGVGWFAMFTDLDGIPIGVLQERGKGT